MTTRQASNFGTTLQRYRLAAGLTQEGLAEQAGLSLRGISDLERSVNIRPRAATVQQLAEALQLSRYDRTLLTVAARGDAVTTEHSRPARSVPGGFLGALPIGALVGRKEEVAQLLGAAESSIDGHGKLVLLTGEPGIGKTRLLQEIMVQLRERGVLALTGRCYAAEQRAPYYPFLDVLAAAYDRAPPALRTEATQRWPYLAGLLPDYPRDSGGDGKPAGADEQQRLFRAVTGFLMALAANTPVALLLDDLHWADGDSLRLLQHLVRIAHGSAVLCMGTYREEDVASGGLLEELLLDLTREQLVTPFPLRLLDRDGTATLLADQLGGPIAPDLVDVVHRRADGNAFFLKELVRSLRDAGDLVWQAGGWQMHRSESGAVPVTVRALIRQRLARLASDSQAILQEASVLGQIFGFEELQAVSGRSEDEVEQAIEAGRVSGVVRAIGAERYTFAHELTHEALYEDIPPRRRRRLHQAAGTALEQRQGRAAELVRHFLVGGDELRALTYALRAGEEAAALFAHDVAEHHLRTAVSLARRLGDKTHEVEALTKLGQVLSFVQFEGALDVLEMAAALHRAAGAVDDERRVVAQIGTIHARRGAPDAGAARIQLLLDSGTSTGSDEALCRLYVAQSRCLFNSGRYREMLEVAERAAELAQTLHENSLLADAESSRGIALIKLGRAEQARLILEEAITMVERAGDSETLLLLIGQVAPIYTWRGEIELGRDLHRRAMQLAHRIGHQVLHGFQTACLGWAIFLLGDWKAARDHFLRAEDILRPLGPSTAQALPPVLLGELALRAGNWQEASTRLHESLAILESARAEQQLYHALRLLAELDLYHGCPETTVSRLQPILNGDSLEEDRMRALAILARAYLAMDRMDEAAQTAADAVRRARAMNYQLDLSNALCVQGMIAVSREGWEEARLSLEEAASIARGAHYPYGEARALEELGMLHRRRGAVDQAGQSFMQAHSIFQRLSMALTRSGTGPAP